jgi:hypothetical protein
MASSSGKYVTMDEWREHPVCFIEGDCLLISPNHHPFNVSIILLIECLQDLSATSTVSGASQMFIVPLEGYGVRGAQDKCYVGMFYNP